MQKLVEQIQKDLLASPSEPSWLLCLSQLHPCSSHHSTSTHANPLAGVVPELSPHAKVIQTLKVPSTATFYVNTPTD